MKIGIAQIACSIGDVEANTAKFYEFADKAKKSNCDLVIFPEMSDMGYAPHLASKYSDFWSLEKPGKAFTTASNAAKNFAINLIAGITERVENTSYNSLAFFNTQGIISASYRKLHLFSPAPASEDQYFLKGNKIILTEIEGVKFGLSICYDLRFPELYRRLTLEGTEVLINIAAWPAKRGAHWDYLTRARAIENQAFFIAVDRVGSDMSLDSFGQNNEFIFNGHSRIISPTGEIICEASADKEELIVGEIDLNLVKEFRKNIPTFKDRRSDLF